MKFTLSWLKSHLDTQATADQVAEALTRIGLEVEGIDNPAKALAPFRIAKVLTAERHPQADKLQVLSVDAGDGPMQVVCGAPNARAGLVGVFGAPGAWVPGSGITLKVAEIRGVVSNGMMCSVRELELGDEHDGIIELAADAPVGAIYADWAGLDDPVFDVAITPNRQDCMGVRGIARDLAAAGLGTLKPLAATPVAGDGPGPHVRTDDPAGCPAFYGQSVTGVTNGAAPAWMTKRLKAIGQKPISALVDITNYVMIDLGRPLHVYDKAKLTGGLVARKAVAGETVLALNGKTYTLDPSMTVIADEAQVHDIGGIMGGEDSGVSETTTDVVIECAYFDPEGIAKTGQKLGLTSDARSRFERGVDPAFLDDGLAIATRLVLDICGGTASKVTRAGAAPVAAKIVAYDPGHAERLGGVVVAPDRQKEILESLGFGVSDARSPSKAAVLSPGQGQEPPCSSPPRGEGVDWHVSVPSWRRDIDGSADIVEEVVRITGLDAVPSTPLPRAPGVARPTATAEQLVERQVRRAAAARGLNEAVTWSFISETEAAAFGGGAWTLANPISEDLKVMRPSLLPGLLAAAARNANRGATAIRLFELGRRYRADAEHPTVALLLAGERSPRHWQTGKVQRFDAFDAKAEALALLAAAGAPVDNLQVMDDAGAVYHPGQSATLRLGPKTILAAFGTLHPTTLKAFDLDGPVAAAEIFLDAIPARRGGATRMRSAYAPPALQPVTRDFAFLLPRDTAADTLLRAVKGADKIAIASARLFDLFEGAGVPEGEKSIAIEVVLQPGAKSFTDEELKAVSDRIVAAAAKAGARLRG